MKFQIQIQCFDPSISTFYITKVEACLKARPSIPQDFNGLPIPTLHLVSANRDKPTIAIYHPQQ